VYFLPPEASDLLTSTSTPPPVLPPALIFAHFETPVSCKAKVPGR